MTMKTLIRYLRTVASSIFLAGFLTACMTNPVTGKRELAFISEDQEVQIGMENYMVGQQSQGGAYITDPELVQYIQGIGDKLASVSDRSHLPFEFVILNNSVPNAWAMPGGKIAINRGLLTEMSTEGELAAVMGHEIVHAAARHGAKGIERGMLIQGALVGVAIAADGHDDGEWAMLGSQLAGSLLNLKYSRGQESESDYYGMLYMSRAGYDPMEAVRLQETFVRLKDGQKAGIFEKLFGSHPPSEDRVEENKRTAAQLPQGGFVGKDEYQAKIARLIRTKPAYEKYDEGVELLNKRDAKAALKLADEAISIEPREALFYGLKGDALASMGNRNQAEKAYDKAIELNPDFYHFRKQRGHMRRLTGNLAGARQDYERCLELLPTDDTHVALGQMAMANHDRKTALAHFEAASASDTHFGQQAAIQVANMTLANMPDRFIHTELSLNNSGYVILKVKNASPIPVTNVRGHLYVYDGNHTQAGGAVPFSVYGTMAPGSVTTIKTKIGPVVEGGNIGDVRAKVNRAEPAN